MIAYRTSKISAPGDLKKLKKKLDKIGNKYRTQICQEISDYANKIGFSLIFDVIMDLKLVGKVKE